MTRRPVNIRRCIADINTLMPSTGTLREEVTQQVFSISDRDGKTFIDAIPKLRKETLYLCAMALIRDCLIEIADEMDRNATESN